MSLARDKKEPVYRWYDDWTGEWHESDVDPWDTTTDNFKNVWNTGWKASYPRKCKSTGIVIHNEKEEHEHKRDYICINHLRTVPPWGTYDSDHWVDP
jgi:hypothetical protein